MSPAGFLHTPVTSVNAIRALLKGYQAGHAWIHVIKELLQNADDVKATRFDLVLLDEGWPGARNPLLRGPTLLAWNNGPFSERDAVGVRTLHGGNQAANAGSIGRFGLGMKSVFHLCEAFLFLGEDLEGRRTRGVLNPWSGLEGRSSDQLAWDQLDPVDRDLLQNFVDDRWFERPRGYFLLCIPLRQDKPSHRHGDGDGGCIRNDAFVTTEELERRFGGGVALAPLLPQLGSIREIQIGRAASAEDELRGVLTVCVRNETGRLCRPSESAIPGNYREPEQAWAMEVHAHPPGEAGIVLNVRGRQKAEPHADLVGLCIQPAWPKRAMHRPGHGVADVPEKALPQGGVTISRRPRLPDEHSVRMTWAVFLPVPEGEEELSEPEQPKAGDRWEITLHGYCFPDSYRRGIPAVSDSNSSTDTDSPSGSSDELLRRWNDGVARRVTFPMLLPAMKDALHGIQIAETNGVLYAVEASTAFRRFRSGVAPHALFIEWKDNSWTLRMANDTLRLLPIPAPANESVWTVVECVVKALGKREIALVQEDAPVLRAIAQPDHWTRDELVGALDDTVVQHLNVRDRLDWVLRLLKVDREDKSVTRTETPIQRRGHRPQGASSQQATRPTPRGEAAFHLLRHAAAWNPRGMCADSVKSLWRAIVELSPQEKLLFCPPSWEAIKELASLNTASILILPKDLEPDERSASGLRPSAEDGKEMLNRLGALAVGARGKTDPDLRKLVEQVVSVIGVQAVQDPKLRALPLLSAWSAKRSVAEKPDAFKVVSADEIDGHKGHGRVFVRGGLLQPEAVAKDLLRTIRVKESAENEQTEGKDIWLVAAEYEKPFGVEKLSAKSIANLLLREPVYLVADPAPRAALLKLIADAGSLGDAKVGQALRYLAHGCASHRDNMNSPLLVDLAQTAHPGGLARALFAAEEREWCLVDPSMRSVLNGDWIDALKIRQLTDSDVVDVIKVLYSRSQFEAVRQTLRPEHENAILCLLAGQDECDLWKAWPGHRMNDGTVGTVDRTTWRCTGQWSVPEALADRVRVIGEAEDPIQRRAQERWVRAWDPTAQVELCLDLLESRPTVAETR